MFNVMVLIGILFCGIQTVRSARPINAALWLAGVSALAAILLYGLGAYQLAVIELSVGAGLVTVLFVFAISLAGDEPQPEQGGVSWLLGTALALACSLLLILFTLPLIGISNPSGDPSFTETVWHERSLDMLVQIVLLFTCALSVVGLLAQRREKPKPVLTPALSIEEKQEQTS